MLRSLPALRALLCATCLFGVTGATGADLDGLAKLSWLKVDSAHFSVITDQPEATARQVVSDLEALRYFKVEVLGVRPLAVPQPLTILALGESGFAKLGFPKSWGGVFALNANGYVAVANIGDYQGESKRNSQARANLLHEYHHFLVRLTEETSFYPRWLDEGLADYWSTFNVDGSNVRLGDRVADGGYGREIGLVGKTGQAWIDTRELMNTAELPMRSFYSSDLDVVGRFYSSAYFAVHYFNSTPELRAMFDRYLRLINLGYRQDRAVELAFKKSYAELDSDILKYARSGISVRVMSSTKEVFQFPKIDPSVTRLDTAAMIAALAHVLPNFGIERPALRELLIRNRQLHPQDADANILPLLTGAAIDQYGGALEKRFPNHPALLTYQGEMLRRRAEFRIEAGVDGALPLLKQARDYFRRAITADPGYPAAYLALGGVYRYMPAGEPLEEAVVGFDTGSIYTRSPTTFANLAGVYLRMNKPLAALPALRNEVAFGGAELKNTDALLLDNLELLNDLNQSAKASADGLDYPGGTHYAGPVSNGKPDGNGKATRLNGSYYEGSFVQGLPEGVGKLVSDRGFVYLGEFERGLARGQGEITYPAGGAVLSYKGQVEYMKPSGKGVQLTAEGRYEGQFEHGRREGQGEYTTSAKAVTLRGRWVDDGFEWPPENGIVFIGPVSAKGLRDGVGVCRSTGAAGEPEACEFKNGARVIAHD